MMAAIAQKLFIINNEKSLGPPAACIFNPKKYIKSKFYTPELLEDIDDSFDEFDKRFDETAFKSIEIDSNKKSQNKLDLKLLR